MAVAVYGHLPTVDDNAEESGRDCYSVFHGLTQALGFAADASMDASDDSGLWGMNDAGGPWTGADAGALCGWFQVVPMSDGRAPLPVVPLAETAVSTVGRFGEFMLSGLEFYLPLPRAGSGYRRLLSGRSWFGPLDSSRRVRLRITLDSGTDPDVVERSDDVLDALGALCPPTALFRFDAADGSAAVEFTSPSPWRSWLGDDGSSTTAHTCTLTATVPEWSPIALGYTVAYISEACRSVGITAEIGVRIAGE